MKLKEIDRTANVAWSPAEVDPVYLAVGTAAQQLDSSFSTNATLELYQFDINQTGLDLPVKATLPCENRFHKLIWGSHGMTGEKPEHPLGIIVGGCDGGVMQVYDASKILKNESPLVLTKSKHTGAVRALDFNPFRSNLVASGASESEIFIWDLTNPKTPMAPGTKVQPADDVSHLAWNKQVEHILASTFPTRCVVWDLRKNEPVIKVSDTTSRIRYKVVEWHPEVATQMCLASEDDNSPVIQLWDLRYATSPLKVIQGHQRGILGMAWCQQDPDLLLTCGKEARILCWNPNFPHPGYELVCDIPTSSQFSFDVSFCPKNPIVIASSSFDGRVSIFGLSGGFQHPVTSSKLADSFPGMDMTLSAPLPSEQPAFLQLRDAPKWLKRPCGASFGFGGKLISFSNTKVASPQQGQPPAVNSVVTISQLVTLPNLIERSKKLEETLQSGSLESYCADKATESGDTNEARIWEFLQANFSNNPRQTYISKLGFDTGDILTKLDNFSHSNINGLADDFDSLGTGAPDSYGQSNYVDGGSKALDHETELLVPTSDNSVDGKINQALLCGSLEIAVNLCLEEERWADALLLASKASPETLMKVQNKYFHKCQNEATQVIRAVVTHDLGNLVERCKLSSWKQVLAVIMTHADQKEFLVLADMLGQRLRNSKDDGQQLGALLCSICSGNLNQLVDVWVGDSDKHRGDSPDDLQDLVEQVMVLKKAGELWGRDSNIDAGPLAEKLVQYSSLLASQGCLELALSFLGDSNDPTIENLRQRLYYSLRCPRPTKAQLNPRSRQSSSSSSIPSLQKRPSYPNTGVSRGNSINSIQTDFGNLVGPAHPPSGSLQQPYGNLYVNPSGPSAPGQFTPPFANGGTQPQLYGSNTSFPVGLPPRPPSTTPASIYNPADVPVSSTMHGVVKEPVARIPLGSSHPPPPASVAAHGWNDPPAIKASNKSKPAQTAPVATVQPITHPIFGSAVPDTGSYQNTYGAPPSAQNTYGAPPPSQNTYGPPPSAQNTYGPPSSSQNAYGPPPPSQNTYGAPPGPPSAQNAYGPPPSTQNAYGAPPQTQKTYGPPQPTQSAFGAPPPTQSAFGTQPTNQSAFGIGAPPPQGAFGVPSPQNAYGAPPPTQSVLGASQPTSNAYGAQPTTQSAFRATPPPQHAYGAPQTQNAFSSQPPPQSAVRATPTPQTSFGAPPLPTKTALGATPPPQNTYGAQPPTQTTQVAPLPPPPTQSALGSQPPPKSAARATPTPPPQNSFGAPPLLTKTALGATQAPPQNAFGPPQPNPSAFGAQPPPQSAFGVGPPQPNQSAFGAQPPPQSAFGVGPPQPNQSAFRAPTPTSQNALGGPPPPQSGFGAAPVSQSGFGAAPLSQTGFGGPSPPQSGCGGQPPPQSGFGGPSPPQSGFGGPPPPQSGFGGPSPPQSGFGGPPPPQSGFGGPPPPQSGFGGPSPPQSAFRAPPPTHS